MAVYTEVTDEALAAFLADYDIGTAVAFRGIAEGVENSNFSLRTTAGDFILTLYEKRVDPAELPWFLGLMEHLHAARSITCPQPVRARDGAALRHLAGRHAAITTFLPGVWPRRVRPEHCAPVGTALAALHRAGADYAPVRINALGRPRAGRHCWPAAWPRADDVAPGLGAELQDGLQRILASTGRTTSRAGTIHADLFPDNVFFLDGKLSGLIDFYFAATDLLAYDVAVCLNAWCFEPDISLNVTKARSLLRRLCRGDADADGAGARRPAGAVPGRGDAVRC